MRLILLLLAVTNVVANESLYRSHEVHPHGGLRRRLVVLRPIKPTIIRPSYLHAVYNKPAVGYADELMAHNLRRKSSAELTEAQSLRRQSSQGQKEHLHDSVVKTNHHEMLDRKSSAAAFDPKVEAYNKLAMEKWEIEPKVEAYNNAINARVDVYRHGKLEGIATGPARVPGDAVHSPVDQRRMGTSAKSEPEVQSFFTDVNLADVKHRVSAHALQDQVSARFSKKVGNEIHSDPLIGAMHNPDARWVERNSTLNRIASDELNTVVVAMGHPEPVSLLLRKNSEEYQRMKEAHLEDWLLMSNIETANNALNTKHPKQLGEEIKSNLYVEHDMAPIVAAFEKEALPKMRKDLKEMYEQEIGRMNSLFHHEQIKIPGLKNQFKSELDLMRKSFEEMIEVLPWTTAASGNHDVDQAVKRTQRAFDEYKMGMEEKFKSVRAAMVANDSTVMTKSLGGKELERKFHTFQRLKIRGNEEQPIITRDYMSKLIHGDKPLVWIDTNLIAGARNFGDRKSKITLLAGMMDNMLWETPLVTKGHVSLIEQEKLLQKKILENGTIEEFMSKREAAIDRLYKHYSDDGKIAITREEIARKFDNNYLEHRLGDVPNRITRQNKFPLSTLRDNISLAASDSKFLHETWDELIKHSGMMFVPLPLGRTATQKTHFPKPITERSRRRP